MKADPIENLLGDRPWCVDDMERIKLEAILKEHGYDDFALAVKIADRKPKACWNSRYVKKLLVRWQEYRSKFLESASEEVWKDDLMPLLNSWGKILTFEVDIEQIKEILNRFPSWWVKKALRASIRRRAGNIRYVKAILYNWETAGGPDKMRATRNQREYIMGLLEKGGRLLEEFTDTHLVNLTAEDASQLIPILKDLPPHENPEPKPRKPMLHELRTSTQEWSETCVKNADVPGIYFVQQVPTGPGGGPIKIGISTNIKNRLDGLQGANPDKLALVATIPKKHDRKSLEQKLHEQFIEINLFSEWFRAEDPLISYIEDLPTFTGWDKNDTQA